MKRLFVLIIVACVGIVFYADQALVAQSSPQRTGEDGVAYWYNNLIPSITAALSAKGKSAWVSAKNDTLKLYGTTKDTSRAFPTHVGPYGLNMPSVVWSFKNIEAATSGDSCQATLQLEVTNESDPMKGTQWKLLMVVDSVGVGNTGTEVFRLAKIDRSDTLSTFGWARFVVRARNDAVEVAGSDTMAITIRPLRAYNVQTLRIRSSF